MGAYERPPAVVAIDDAFVTDEDTPIGMAVLGNDLGDGPLVIAGFTQPAGGTVTDNGDGTLTFSPDLNFNGSTSFEYTAALGVTRLTASDPGANDEFGGFVAIDGNYAIAGSQLDDANGTDSGSAYIFELVGGVWTQVTKLLPSGLDAVYEGDYFGGTVDIDGACAIVGASGDDDQAANAGAAYIYRRDAAGHWNQEAKLLAADGASGDRLSWVSLDGDRAAAGATFDDDGRGAVCVFERDALGNWAQVAKVVAFDGGTSDRFGSVAIAGDWMVVGAYHDSDAGSNSGSAYVFRRDASGTWNQIQKLRPSDLAYADEFGQSTAIDGEYLVVNARYDNNEHGEDAGPAYVYHLEYAELSPGSIGIPKPGSSRCRTATWTTTRRAQPRALTRFK
jgi:hypothetical protein